MDKDGNKFKADAEAVKVFRSSFAKLDDAFCSDAFGTAHRAHASMVGDCFPVKCSGFLVAKELDAFANVLDNAARPVLAISGGAKVSDKIQLIKNTLYEDDYDTIVVVAVGSYHSDVYSYLEELLFRSTWVCTIWTTTSLTSATSDRASTPARVGVNITMKWLKKCLFPLREHL